MITAYDAPSARFADTAGIDAILVGDSAAMTVFGYDQTTAITLEDMLLLARAARRGTSRALLVADMPFGSVQVSDAETVANAVRFVKEAGVDAVKIEGAGPMAAADRRGHRRGHSGRRPHRPDAAVGRTSSAATSPRAARRHAAERLLDERGRSNGPAAWRSCSRRFRRLWRPPSRAR